MGGEVRRCPHVLSTVLITYTHVVHNPENWQNGGDSGLEGRNPQAYPQLWITFVHSMFLNFSAIHRPGSPCNNGPTARMG